MSYDLDIVKTKAGNSASVEEVINFTSNLGPMINTALKRAFPDLYPTGDEWWREHVDGVRCDKVLVLFEGILKEFKATPKIFRNLEPSNKWGTLKDMKRITEEEIIPALKRHPKRYVRIYA